MKIENLSLLIDKFKQIKIKQFPEKTFMEISGFPHWENVSSNILAFYLNPNKPHHLDDLLLSSLLQITKQKLDGEYKSLMGAEDFDLLGNLEIYNKISVQIQREFPANSKRIDLVIQSNSFVIGIENKIGADLYNNLDIYTTAIKKLAKEERFFIGIVLSVKKENPFSKFINITYSEFFNQIEKNISKYMYRADNKYFVMLLDFMQTIIKPDFMSENAELINFFAKKDNYSQSKKLATLLPRVETEIKVNFWEEVRARIATKFEPLGLNFEFSLDRNRLTATKPNGKFYFHFDGLLNNQVFYGIRLFDNSCNLKIKELINKEYGKQSEIDTVKWVWLHRAELNLTNEEDMNKIIIDKDLYIKKFIDEFSEFIKKIDDISDEIFKLKNE